ncbi:hypothetical protein EVAR_69393_1 [Eumeta japonica]|uniref:Uncharacterized protein n=1 Tax=Eumeta variegata TaxID=151549 RepID=A0A4C1ZYP5_EUMVA|nr:hypothetical protein EVAR_69393_1 [Eumeta japonica]
MHSNAGHRGVTIPAKESLHSEYSQKNGDPSSGGVQRAAGAVRRGCQVPRGDNSLAQFSVQSRKLAPSHLRKSFYEWSKLVLKTVTILAPSVHLHDEDGAGGRGK